MEKNANYVRAHSFSTQSAPQKHELPGAHNDFKKVHLTAKKKKSVLSDRGLVCKEKDENASKEERMQKHLGLNKHCPAPLKLNVNSPDICIPMQCI